MLLWAVTWAHGSIVSAIGRGGSLPGASAATALGLFAAVGVACAGILLILRRGPASVPFVALGTAVAHRIVFVFVPAVLAQFHPLGNPLATLIRKVGIAALLGAVIPDVLCLCALAWFLTIPSPPRRAAEEPSPAWHHRDPVITLATLVLLARHSPNIVLLAGAIETLRRSCLRGAVLPSNIGIVALGVIAALATLIIALAVLLRLRGLAWPTAVVLFISILHVAATQHLAVSTWAPELGSINVWAVTSLLERFVLLVTVIASCSGEPGRAEES